MNERAIVASKQAAPKRSFPNLPHLAYLPAANSMPRSYFNTIALAAILTATSTTGAAAQTQTEPDGSDSIGRRLFEEGRRAFDEERYEDAHRYFVEAHRHSGRTQLLYNVGLSAARLGRNEEAADAFEAYLIQLPDADNAAEVRARLAVLRPSTDESPAPATSEGPKGWLIGVSIGAGVLVIAGVVLAVVLATGDPGQEHPIPGDVGPGGTVTALRFGR